MKKKYWLSIDIGIFHLGLVLIKIGKNWSFEKIVWHSLENITIMKHNKIPLSKCTLGHTKTITDRMAHVYQEYEWVFDKCEKIIIERQPPLGFQAIQESIFCNFRDKAKIVSPIKMHNHFKIKDKNYDERKNETVKIACDYFENADPEIKEKFFSYRDKKNCEIERQHDIADAICLAIMELDIKRSKFEKELKDSNIRNYLLQFRRNCGVVDKNSYFIGSKSSTAKEFQIDKRVIRSKFFTKKKYLGRRRQ